MYLVEKIFIHYKYKVPYKVIGGAILRLGNVKKNLCGLEKNGLHEKALVETKAVPKLTIEKILKTN